MLHYRISYPILTRNILLFWVSPNISWFPLLRFRISLPRTFAHSVSAPLATQGQNGSKYKGKNKGKNKFNMPLAGQSFMNIPGLQDFADRDAEAAASMGAATKRQGIGVVETQSTELIVMKRQQLVNILGTLRALKELRKLLGMAVQSARIGLDQKLDRTP